MPARIIIGADIAPTASNEEIFKTGDISSIADRELLDYLSSSDYRIFNLELPLTTSRKPIKKCGPNLMASPECVNGMKALGIDFVSLANNHILDQGERGLLSTVETLKKAGICYSGVGRNSEEAAKPFIFNISGVRIGIYCCAEHEFSIAEENKMGANPFDPFESLDHIKALKDKCDYVICLYHGGKELYRYPSPSLQKTCRKIISKGADLVICQHSHCVGCMEEYLGGTIVYGQGNFLFHSGSGNEYWSTGLLVQVSIGYKKDTLIEYVPISQNGVGIKIADGQEKEEILQQFFARSKQIKDPEFVKENYKNYANEELYHLLTRIDGFSSFYIFKVFNKISRGRLSSWYFRHTTLKKKRYSLINTIECETWQEMILSALKNEEGLENERK